MEYKIAVIPGDGIGVDVIREAVRSLDKIGEVYGHQFHKVERLVGGCCIDAYGVPIQPETLELCRECDAILFGAAGGPKWDHLPRAQRPESGLAALRRGFNLFCNLRPAKLYPDLRENSPLKNEVLDRGLDLLLVRDLIGGIYFGERGRKEVNGQPAMWNVTANLRWSGWPAMPSDWRRAAARASPALINPMRWKAPGCGGKRWPA